MALKLERQKTLTTPYILIDEENHYMKFEGESYLEDIAVFFMEVNEWLETYLPTDFSVFTFDCCMEYFNSSSTKLLYNLMRLLDMHAIGGKKIIVNWYATDDNDITIECGEDFKDEMKNLEFNLVIQN
jgi:hypothetical protein